MAEIILTVDNFKEKVTDQKGLVLVDFWAEWCGPCKMLSPILKEIAEEYEGKLTIGKVNVDENMDLAMGFRVASIPMLILFKDGAPVEKAVGYAPKGDIVQIFEKYL